MSVNKFQLIEEVRKRPLLWDSRTLPFKRNRNESAAQWVEISQILNVNEAECRQTWTSLRTSFRREACRITERIAKAKSIQKYYPRKKYCRWRYFDALRFLARGFTDRSAFHENFWYVSKRMEEIEKDQIEPEVCNSSIFHTESDATLQECDTLNRMQTESPKYFEDDYNIEIILEDDLDQTECHQENYFENTINPVDDTTQEDNNFKAYTVSISSFRHDSECAAICNKNAVLESDPVVKEEPEIQIKTEKDPVENEGSTLDDELEEFISSTPDINVIKIEHPAPSAFPEEHTSNTPDLNDEDYSFLYSFLSQTKIMTQLQKSELHVKMKNLLVNIFPTFTSANILEKQILLPDDDDPDRKFLISFWPFLKSMSFRQNLQFRAKIADLVLQILSSETI